LDDAPLPETGQGYGLAVGVRKARGLSPVPARSVTSSGAAPWHLFLADPREQLITILCCRERYGDTPWYRAFLRNVVYGALED
jgi:hypothetical protein